jgi:uncharacterized protein (DUF1330 family)
MSGYLIAKLEVTDPAGYDEYRQKLPAVIAKFGGRILVSSSEGRKLEGDTSPRRIVVVEFPSLEAAQNFYDSTDYQPLLKLRLASARGDLVLVQGYSG